MAAICDLSEENLNSIFCFLSPKDIATCRIVCLKWKNTVDQITLKSVIWRVYCQKDYGDICDSAHCKLRRGLSWYHLYKSLTLWSKISETSSTIDEFALAQNNQDDIQKFGVIRHGEMWVLKKRAIEFYNVNTLQKLDRTEILYDCIDYYEGDDFVILVTENNTAEIFSKETNFYITEFANVKLILYFNNMIYYVTNDNWLNYVEVVDCNLIMSTVRYPVPPSTISLGYKIGDNRLFILHKEESSVLVLDEFIVETARWHYDINFKNFLSVLRTFNFLEQIHWNKIHDSINDNKSDEICKKYSWHGIVAMRSYGRILLVAYAWRMLSIFELQPDDEIKHIIHNMPLKEYRLFKNIEPGTRILNIDVVEDNNSHIVLLATSKKIIRITIDHGLPNDPEDSDF